MGNRKAFIDELKKINAAMPKSVNIDATLKKLEEMSETAFKENIIANAEAGKWTPRIAIPAFSEDDLDMDKMLDHADKEDIELFTHLTIVDQKTGISFRTPERYLVAQALVRRQEQHLEHKNSMPDDQYVIDHLSGQPTGASKGAGMSIQEVLILEARKLGMAALEAIKIRGGDAEATRAMVRSLVDTGSFSVREIVAMDTLPKAVETASAMLTAQHLGNNLMGDRN